MPRRKNPQRTEILKKAVEDMFIYDEKRGDVYYNPDMSATLRTPLERVINVPVGKLRLYKTPKRIYSYRVINIPIKRYDTENCLGKNAGGMVMIRHIVWFLNTGVWPDGNVLHKDENPNNCRFENLVHIRPEYMHVYQRLVNLLDMEKISAYVEGVAQKSTNAQSSFTVAIPVFDAAKQKFVGKKQTFHDVSEACNAMYNARYERLIWVRDNRLGGVDTTFYDNGLDLPKTKPLVPCDDAPHKVEQVVEENDGSKTPFVASLLIGAANFISNRRKR